MNFRRFLVRYVIGGAGVQMYAESISQLEEFLSVPRSWGVGWSFRSVA